MASSPVAIVNRALLNLGVTTPLKSLDEARPEARAAKLVWDDVRDQVLREVQPQFATAFAELAEVATSRPGWAKVFALPVDQVKVVALVDENGTELRHCPRAHLNFELVAGDDGQAAVLCCNEDTAQIRYVRRIEDPRAYPADFVAALAWAIAAEIASGLTDGDTKRLRARQEYLLARSAARASDGAERRQAPEKASYHAVRG